MLAPSVAAQFSCTMPQMKTALLEMGFLDVFYVAEGADQTAEHEANEFIERGGTLMTTSCCPSFVKIIERHVPELTAHLSTTPSPMVFTAQKAKQLYPNAQTVFIGPCIAKKAESFQVSEVDMVINFEELLALLQAANIDPAYLTSSQPGIEASADGWGFAGTGGVLNAVVNKLPDNSGIKPLVLNGIDKKGLKQLKLLKKQTQFNFIEGMSCEGGCVGGCYMNVKPVLAQKRMQRLQDEISAN